METDWSSAADEALLRFRAKPVEERAARLAEVEALELYNLSGDPAIADYAIAYRTLCRRLGREPTEAEVQVELKRM